MLWTSVLEPSHCVPNCVCVSGTGGLWQHTFGHSRMTWEPKDMPSYAALFCPSLCRMLEAVR